MTTPTPNKPDTASPVDKMNAYKGGSFPSPVIPVLGFALGWGVPFALVKGNLVTSGSGSGNDAVGAIVSTLQSFGYVR